MNKKLWQADKSPLVTGISLCYNKLDFCQPAIESVLQWNGLGDEFEYIVWDQGSPYPGVKWYIENLRNQDIPNLKIMGDSVNIGVGAALNRAIEYSNSEFVFKFDDDNKLMPFTLPAMLLTYILAVKHGIPLAVLSADVIGVGKAGGPYNTYELSPGVVLESCWCVGGGCVLISRDALNQVGPFNEDRIYGIEDGDFAYRAVQKGFVNAYLKGAFHVSRCRGEEADPAFDKWKLYYHDGGELQFDDWVKEGK